MNKLMCEAHAADLSQRIGEARVNRFRRHPVLPVFKYKAPNGMMFTIDTRPLESGGVPLVTSSAAEGYGASHASHTLGDGKCCVATPDVLRQMDLLTLLVHIDSWAKGMEMYKKGFAFPGSPKDAFSKPPEQKSGGILDALFG